MGAVKRELLEETGYAAKEITFWYATQPTSKVDWAVYIFIANGSTKVQEPQPDSGEKIQLEAISFDTLLKLIVKEEFRDAEIALKMLRILNQSDGSKGLKRIFFDTI